MQVWQVQVIRAEKPRRTDDGKLVPVPGRTLHNFQVRGDTSDECREAARERAQRLVGVGKPIIVSMGTNRTIFITARLDA